MKDFSGDSSSDADTLLKYATDASAFSITPTTIHYPKNVADIVALVHACNVAQAAGADTSLTVRAGGTCMSGGALNDSWIIDMTRYMKSIVIDSSNNTAEVDAGAYFRDIEAAAKVLKLSSGTMTSSMHGIAL